MGPYISPLSAIPSLTGSIFEQASEDNTKKVRFNDEIVVVEINLERVNSMEKQARLQLVVENRQQRLDDRKNKRSYNLDSCT
jgi:hypothetical protein